MSTASSAVETNDASEGKCLERARRVQDKAWGLGLSEASRETEVKGILRDSNSQTGLVRIPCSLSTCSTPASATSTSEEGLRTGEKAER